MKIIIWVSISFILFFEKVSKSDRLRDKYTLYFMHAHWKVMLGIVFNVDYNAYHFIECPFLSFQKGRLILRPRPSWPMLLKYMIMKWFFLLFIVEDTVLKFQHLRTENFLENSLHFWGTRATKIMNHNYLFFSPFT